MTLAEFLRDARKACTVAVSMEGTAVALGLITSAEAGYITAVIGAVTTVVTYCIRNERPRRHPSPGPRD